MADLADFLLLYPQNKQVIMKSEAYKGHLAMLMAKRIVGMHVSLFQDCLIQRINKCNLTNNFPDVGCGNSILDRIDLYPQGTRPS